MMQCHHSCVTDICPIHRQDGVEQGSDLLLTSVMLSASRVVIWTTLLTLCAVVSRS